MEFTEEEEDSIENHPSLPPNYLSLAQLREQWLQKQMKKETVEEPKGNREQKKEPEQNKKQAEQDGKLNLASQRLRQDKGKKKVCEEEPGRGRNEWKRVEGSQRVYVSKPVLGANRSEIVGHERLLKSEEPTKQGSSVKGVAGVGGVEEKNVVERKKKKNKKKNGWKKRVNRADGDPVGAMKNPGNLGDSDRIAEVEDKCKGELGKNGHVDKEVEGKYNVFMNRIAPKNEGEEVNLLVMGAKCGYDKGLKEQDCRLVRGVFSVSTVELFLKSEVEEKVPVAGDDFNQRIPGAETVCMAAESPERNADEDCSVNVGRNKRGKRRFGSRYKRSVHNQRNLKDPKDSKMELECEKNLQDGVVSDEEQERNGVQKERIARAAQPFADKKMVEDKPTPKIGRDLRSLSLEENKEGKVALRKNGNGWQKRGCERSRDTKGLVWVKRGEISDSN